MGLMPQTLFFIGGLYRCNFHFNFTHDFIIVINTLFLKYDINLIYFEKDKLIKLALAAWYLKKPKT